MPCASVSIRSWLGRATGIRTIAVRLLALLLSSAFCAVIGQADETWQPPDEDYDALALSPDRELILGVVSPFDTGSSLRLFNTGTASAKTYPSWETSNTDSAAFSLDGRYLAAASGDGTILVWRVDTHKRRWVLKGHNGAARAMAFSADGTTLASSSQNHTIELWNVSTGRKAATLTSQKSVIVSLHSRGTGQGLLRESGKDTPRFGMSLNAIWSATSRGIMSMSQR